MDVRSYSRVCLFVAALHLSIGGAFARSALEDLTDSDLEAKALLEVSRMGREDLSALSEVLAACAHLGALDDGMPRYYCNRELVRFQTSGAGGHIQTLVRAVYNASRLLNMRGVAEKRIPNYEALLVREAVLYRGLLDVASLRASDLSNRSESGGKK